MSKRKLYQCVSERCTRPGALGQDNEMVYVSKSPTGFGSTELDYHRACVGGMWYMLHNGQNPREMYHTTQSGALAWLVKAAMHAKSVSGWTLHQVPETGVSVRPADCVGTHDKAHRDLCVACGKTPGGRNSL